VAHLAGYAYGVPDVGSVGARPHLMGEGTDMGGREGSNRMGCKEREEECDNTGVDRTGTGWCCRVGRIGSGAGSQS